MQQPQQFKTPDFIEIAYPVGASPLYCRQLNNIASFALAFRRDQEILDAQSKPNG
jgi:hypothetical protein